MAVAIDKISTMTLPNYSGLGIAIEDLTAKQVALVLSTRNLSQSELEEVVRINNLIEKYGAEQLIKTGLLSENSSLLVSEKAVNAEKLKESIIQSTLNKEKAEEFIQTQLSIVSDGEESASTIILNKALMDEAVKRGILTEERAVEILSIYGVVVADNTEIGSKKGLIAATLGLIKSKIALSAIDTAAVVGVSALIFTIYKCNKAVKESRDRAQELGNSFNETSSTIDDYKSKIEELYKIINDNNSSIEDVTTARQTLISIQDELIDKFGIEKGVINDVTDAINGQTGALDRLSNATWQEVKNEFNDGGFWNDAANFFQDTNNIERMLSEYGERTILFKWADYADINKFTDEMVAELENIGIDIKVSTDDLQGVRDFNSLVESISDTKGASLSITGNAEEIYNQLLSLQKLIGNNESLDKLYDKVEYTTNSYKELTDSYKDFYNQYILYEKILTEDSEYADIFKAITDAAENYNDAFASGDEKKIKEAADKYASTVSTAMSTAANKDSDVATYFENMYPTLKPIVDGWNFNNAFDENTDELQGKVQNVLDELKDKNGRSLTAEEILGLDESNEQYQALISIAHPYNMTPEEMIELLKERNLVSAMDYQGLVGLFGQENINKLSPKDLELAYTIKNIGNMTFEQLQSEIQKTKETADEMEISSLSITETIDQLNTQLKPAFDSLSSAWNNIFTLDDNNKEIFSLDSVNTDMLYSIQDAIFKINAVEGVSIDLSSYENLAKVLTNSSSKASDVKNSFNELASSIIDGVSVTKGFNDQTKNLCAQLLKEMGIINADQIVIEKLNQSKIQQKAASIDFSDATADEIRNLTAYGEELGFTSQQVYGLYLQQLLVNDDPLQTKRSILQLIGLCQAGSETADTLVDLYDIMDAISKGRQKLANGALTAAQAEVTKSEIEKLQKEMSDKVNNMISSNVETDWDGADDSKPPSSSSPEKDTRLEEYRQKLEELQTMLDRELINERDFYEQSDALLNDYLKDTPAHMQKYADEISNAEKTLRGNWISSFGYEKSQLEKDLSDSALVRWQYYEQLSELAEQYYNTEGASYGKFADEYEEITQEIKEGQEKLWDDIFSEVNSQLDSLQSACETVRDAVEEYSENGSLSIDTMQKLIALEPQYMSMLFDENGQLQLNAEAYERLAKTKLEELKIDLAGQALNTINSLQSEAQAVELLTGKYAELRDTSAGAIEQQLRDAVTDAYGRGEKQGQAAETVLQAYINQKKVLDATDLSSLSITAQPKDDGTDQFLKTFDWIGTLLKKISDKTSKLIDKVDKFYNWQKKNSMINRAVKAADKEINQNELAYRLYMKKADSVGLGLNYVRKVQDGTLSFEDITDEMLSDKIDKYQEWYDKAQDCLDTIEDLYDRQRDLIRQKLNNVLDYYSDMDSYLSSVTSKIESIISLNDEMGKRSSLTELVEQFAAVSDRLENNTTAKNTAAAGMTDDTAVSEVSFGDSKKVAEAREHDRKELTASIQSKIDALDVKKTGAYERLADSIAKTQAQIDNYRDRGWDKSKAKSYEKLQKKLQDYHDLQKALDENATSDTIANYEKIYTKYQKLQNKLDSGKSLSKSEQKRYDSYAEQLDGLKVQGQSKLDRLRSELAEADGTAAKQSEADRIKGKIDSVQSDLENTATYQSLKRKIETTQSSIAEFDKAGYDNLTNKQKKAYDKMQKQLEDYYAQKKSLDEGATASNIAEYNKTYLAWKKLQDKIDNKKTLSTAERKKYNEYRELLDGYSSEKSDMVSELNDALAEASDPSDKLGQIQKTYEEASKDLYDSYQNQIDSINGGAEGTAQYQNLLAKAQNLEAKKADKKKNFTASDQAKLDEYNAELEALRAGATGSNIGNYMKIWKAWYKLELKRKKNGSLKGSDITNYDKYTALLKAWNEEKQTQISDLHSLMEDDLEQLKKTYDENMAEAESEINDYHENLYSLAKQIAEYNISSLQTQLDYLDSYISYYKELVSLYDSFSGEKLTKILTDLDENALAKKTDVYEKYLHTLQDKYNTTLAEMNEYRQLLGALDSNDFESSMELFNKAMENYKSEGNDAMADKLQSVLNLLNERAADADNWDEYADQWANEWEEALSSAKQELIGTASEIQDINDALREIRFENITDAIEELDRAAGILSSIEGLIQDGWLFDDGQMTEYGRAKTALLVSQLEDAQAKADAYLDLYNEIQNNKDTYASDKAYQADLNDALQNYYDALGSAASFENSIMDLMKQNAEEEINSLKDVIEARKKALQSKKEYYDYDKSIRNSQKEIDSLKAQIDALENLSGATDAATKAKLAQLRAELAQKEESLQETKDEHTFNLQIDALDEFADSLTNALDNSSKSVEEILKEQKETVESAKELYQTSAESISVILQKLEAFYKGKGALSDEALLGLVGENVFQYAQANTPQIAFHAETAIPDIIRERNAAPPINVHYDSLIHVEGNIDKEVADLLPEQLEQSYQYVVQQIYSDIRSVSSVKPAARSVI